MKKGALITIVAILLPWLLQAQSTTPDTPQRLSLEEAVNFAVEHNKELQASQLDIELRNKMVLESISQGLPQINAGLDYVTYFGKKMDLMGTSMDMASSTVTGSVSQLLFSGQWILGIQTSKIAKQIAAQQVDITELDIKENVNNS